MKRSLNSGLRASAVLLAALSLGTLAGCSEDPAINRVGVNVVDKGLFTGSWYYSTVVIDVDYAASGLGTYPGDAAYDFAVGGITSMPRVRWVIDEDTLYAYRDYELIEGANINRDGSSDPNAIYQPVAAFAIESHFDIRRDYNATTGEEINVLVENDTDGYWYERDYMRVDWSVNLLPNYYGQITELYEILGLYDREPSTLFVQGASDFPESWRPQFNFMSCTSLDDENCDPAERDYAEEYEQGELYHFSFVTQDILSPGTVPDPFTGRPVNYCLSPYAGIPDCASTAVYVRNSFMKVSESRQYVAENWPDSRFDRHGYFRLERGTYDRSSGAGDPQQGYTDFMNYNVNRHNIWREWNDEAGAPLPFGARRTRPLTYYTSTELPAHLVEPSFDLVGAWSQVFMETVRNLRGQADAVLPRTSCQNVDPEAYCFCTANPDTGEIINPTCAGHWDPFITPDQYASLGVTDPYDCWVDVPAGAQPDLENPGLSDEDFYGWYGASFRGSECMVQLHVNTCNRATIAENGGTTQGMDCQERGDMRFNLLSYVDQPGTPFLGVATLRGDPVSGELRAGDANIGGPALDGYRTSAMQQYDLINGNTTDRSFLIGEDIREYLNNVDRIQPPVAPREPFLVANVAGAPTLEMPAAIRNRMDNYVERGMQLAGNEGRARTFSDRRELLRGTDIERRLMANEETLAMAGIDILPEGVGTADINDHILDRVSPFRRSAGEILAYQRDMETRISSANVMMPNEFVDASVLEFVNRHRDWNRAKLEIVINQLLYYQTQLHELGHCLGLRHDFGASADIGNYDDDYYIIDDALPNAQPSDFDLDGTPGLSQSEQLAFEAEYTRMKDLRELAGIDRWMNSSIMEYTAQWYERTSTTRGAGRYDHSAINSAYGELTEIYDNSEGTALADINPVNTPRIWVKFYNGGESCNVDSDCPFGAGGVNEGLLLAGNAAAGLVQRCAPHPNGAERGNMCTNFNNDLTNIVAAGGAAPRYVSVDYNYCTDDIVGYRADCHRFDEGDSYREIVANLSEQYDRQYIFTNFRRYRSGFSLGGYLFNRLIGRQYNILQAMFQNLLSEYVNNPEYQNTTGNFGFDDHFLATADIVNFYSRVISQPPLGSYFYDEGWGRYQKAGGTDDPNVPGAQLSLPLGMARYDNSEYQAGLSGIQRIERIGSFYEKWFTMQMLTERGNATGYTRDVPFWTNYYDLFPQEMQQLFQGLILNQPEQIAPRVVCNGGAGRNCLDPQLQYMDFYAGDPANPREPVTTRYQDLEHVDSGFGVTLQFLASFNALADFPVFFDTTFQNQMFVCVAGEGSCPVPDAGLVEGEDYIEYQSANFGKTFRAWQVEGTDLLPNQRSIGFEMIREAKEFAFLLNALKTYRGDFGGGSLSAANLSTEQRNELRRLDYTLPGDATALVNEISRVDGRIRSNESFFFQTQQLLRQLGIASYLRF